jgi:hypothetical protein
MRRLAAMHLIGNAAILWLGYYWLGIGEARASALLWSLVVALFTTSLFCWLHGAGFVCGTERQLIERRRGDWLPYLTALRNLGALLAISVCGLLIYLLLAKWGAYSGKPAFTVASFLTMKLRKPVKPAAVLQFFNAVLWFVRWVVLPVLILPSISAIAARGWRGFGALKSLRRDWRYWLEVPLLLLAALWLPFRLMAWTPFMTGFGIESFSLAARGLAAYLLFVVGLLTLEALSQPNQEPPLPHTASRDR